MKTKHFVERLNQRGISNELLFMVEKYGEFYDKDKIRLGKKEIDSVLKELEDTKKNLIKARDKGGIEIVHSDEVFITCYPIY